MTPQLHSRSLYLAGFLFVALNLVLIAFEVYALLLLPLVALLFWGLIRKPVYVVCFLAFATPLSINLSTTHDTLSMSIPTEPLIILLFLGILIKWIQGKPVSEPLLGTALSILVLTDLAWLAVTSLSSSMPLISLKYLLSKVWYVAVFYFMIGRMFRKEQVIKAFMWAFVMGCVILAGYTLYHHAQGSFSRSYAYTAMRPFLPDHGMYAACISFSVPILFVFTVHGGKLGYGSFLRILSLGLLAFMLVAVALSFTRASWLSLVVAFGIYVALQLRIRFAYLLTVGLIGLAMLAVNLDDLLTELSRNKSESDDNIEEHLQSVSNVTSDPSNLERLNRWSCAYRMWEERPVLGFGPGTYTFQYGSYQLPHQMTIISTNVGDQGNVHSEYLRPLVESGFPGLLITLATVILSFYYGFVQFRSLEGPFRYLSLAAFLALVTYFSHGVLNNYSEFDKIAVPMFACMALLSSVQRTIRQTAHDPETVQE